MWGHHRPGFRVVVGFPQAPEVEWEWGVEGAGVLTCYPTPMPTQTLQRSRDREYICHSKGSCSL